MDHLRLALIRSGDGGDREGEYADDGDHYEEFDKGKCA
jgi:hypothetical protein